MGCASSKSRKIGQARAIAALLLRGKKLPEASAWPEHASASPRRRSDTTAARVPRPVRDGDRTLRQRVCPGQSETEIGHCGSARAPPSPRRRSDTTVARACSAGVTDHGSTARGGIGLGGSPQAGQPHSGGLCSRRLHSPRDPKTAESCYLLRRLRPISGRNPTARARIVGGSGTSTTLNPR